MKEEEQHETKQRRIWAVTPPASAAHWAVTQGELLAQAAAMAPGRMVLALALSIFPGLLLPGGIREGTLPRDVGWALQHPLYHQVG